VAAVPTPRSAGGTAPSASPAKRPPARSGAGCRCRALAFSRAGAAP
jgi:hypothetical protein